MACSFAEVRNGCGCIIGYAEPLLTDADAAITYPLQVINVDGDPVDSEPIIGTDTVSSPTDYCAVWNSDASNKAIGTLYVGTGAYCFYLVLKPTQGAPSKVIGVKKK